MGRKCSSATGSDVGGRQGPDAHQLTHPETGGPIVRPPPGGIGTQELHIGFLVTLGHTLVRLIE